MMHLSTCCWPTTPLLIVQWVNPLPFAGIIKQGLSAATSHRISPRVTSPALVIWQSTRPLVAGSGCPGKINLNTTYIVVGDTSRRQRWEGGVFVF